MVHPIKVAFFLTALDSGGLENYLLRFLNFYKGKIEATVYSKAGRSGQLDGQFQKLGVQLRPFKVSYFDFWNYYKLFVELKNQNYDAICDFTGNMAGSVLYVAHKAKIPNRISFYRGSTHHFKPDFFRLKYDAFQNKLVERYASSILFNSKVAKKFFYPKTHEKDSRMAVIYNGIDINKFITTKENLRERLNIPKNAFVVGNVGRYSDAKNHKTIIKVAIDLCKKEKDIHFLLCGNRVDTSLQEIIIENNLSQQIHALPNQDHVIKVFNTLDCFYFPSATEGQPNALLEAMALNIPFVASDIEPIQEVIPKALFTQLIPPLDAEQAKQKILSIKTNNELSKFSNLQDWVKINNNPEELFRQFFEKLNPS